MMRKLLLQIFLLLLTTSLCGQTTFSKIYFKSPSVSFIPVNIVKGTYDDIFLGGVSSQKSIISHLNSLGDTLWSKEYTCPTCPYNWLWLEDFIRCADGNLALVGKHYLNSSSFNTFIIKIDSLGNLLWENTVSQGLYNNALISEGIDSCLYFTRGNYLFKTNSSGNLLWSKYFDLTDSINDFYFSEIKSTSDGLVIAGTYRNWDTSSSNVYDLVIIKTDTSGNIVWKKRYDGSIGDELYSIFPLPNGSFIAAGRTFAEGAGWLDALIIKMDNLGNINWLKTYGDTSSNQGNSISQISTGELICTGYSYLEYSMPSNANIILIKTDSIGNPIFIKGYGDSLEQYCYNTIITSNNESITLFKSGSTARALLYKIDANGTATCFERTENFTVDSPTFIEQTFPLIITPVSISSYSIPAVSSYTLVFDQEYCYTLDVDEFHKNRILVYPNPSYGHINFSGLYGENKIEVFDILGKLVFSSEFKETIASIDLSKNLNGIYLYSITNKINGVQRGKFILH